MMKSSSVILIWIVGVLATADAFHLQRISLRRNYRKSRLNALRGDSHDFIRVAKSVIAVATAAVVFSSGSPTIAADDSAVSFQEQLRLLQAQKVEQQKKELELQEQELMTRIIQYPEGTLIARGSIRLQDTNINPYGLSSPADLDQAFSSNTGSLFILAVGRQGPPLAAKRLDLKDVQFPTVFELTTDDLIFPYTAEAWLNSDNSKDTIALTAILSPSKKLSEPSYKERFGFGLSDPITFAGKLSRSDAKLRVSDKVQEALYTAEEVKLLEAVDNGLALNEKSGKKNAAPISKKQLESSAQLQQKK